MSKIFNRCGVACCIIFSAMALMAGCASDNPTPKDMPNLYPCEISLTQDGVSLAMATIMLVPSDGKRDWYVGGVTDATGTVRLLTSSRWEGAPSGSYKVVVFKDEVEPSNVVQPSNTEDEAAMQEYQKLLDAEPPRQMFSLVEAAYSSTATTPLVLEVTGKTKQTFEVGKPVRIKK